MGRGSIDHLMEIGWIKLKGRKNIPGKPSLWVTTDVFLEHLQNVLRYLSDQEIVFYVFA